MIARSHRSLAEEVFFLTGTGRARAEGATGPRRRARISQAYCDELAVSGKALAARLNAANDDFVRTTQPRHKAVVRPC